MMTSLTFFDGSKTLLLTCAECGKKAREPSKKQARVSGWKLIWSDCFCSEACKEKRKVLRSQPPLPEGET